jgi:hypothetical protein
MNVPDRGVYATVLVLVSGMLLAPRFADYMVAEPALRHRMRTRAMVGIGVFVAIAAIAAAAFWVVLAAFVSPDGCAWIAGIGGCLAR